MQAGGKNIKGPGLQAWKLATSIKLNAYTCLHVISGSILFLD